MSSRSINKKSLFPAAPGAEEVLQQLQNGISTKKQELLEKISQFVDGNLARKITLREVAAHFGVSVSTVTQLFQNCGGITYHRYLTDRRMRMAQELIQEGFALEEVGRMVGYGDHSTFYRAFRQSFGVSPREYRRRQLMEQT